MLTDAERTDARRFWVYPACGAGAAGNMGWRLYHAYEFEYRLSNLSHAELAVIHQFLGTLRLLEAAVPRAAENLDTDQAAVWTHHPNEIRDRSTLLADWSRRLCAFFGVPPEHGLQ